MQNITKSKASSTDDAGTIEYPYRKTKKTLSMMYKKTLKWSIELHVKAENYKTPTKKM